MKNKKYLIISVFILCAAAVAVSIGSFYDAKVLAAEGNGKTSDIGYYNGQRCAVQQVIIVYENTAGAKAYASEMNEIIQETADTPQPSAEPAKGSANSSEPKNTDGAEDDETSEPSNEPSETPTPTDEPKKAGIMTKASVLQTNKNVVVVKVDADVDMAEFIKEAQSQPGVKYAQPNYIYSLFATVDDPYANINEERSGWHLHTIDAFGAWDYTFGSSEIVVGVIDTGVDVDHPDLQANILRHWDTHDEDGDGNDVNGHGTMVSGYIAAIANNGIGSCGVAPECKLIVVDAFNDTYTHPDYDGVGAFETLDIVEAIDYLISQDVDVINMSLGGEGSNSMMEDAVNRAYAAGIVVIAAAGNDGLNIFTQPSDFENVISVMASPIADDYLWSLSNYGEAKDITAPGVSVASTYLGGGTGYGDGTSFAAPIVSGTVALMLSIDSTLTPAEVAQMLYDTADDTCTQRDAGGTSYGAGRINAYEAVKAVYDSQNITAIEITPEFASLNHSETLKLTTTLTPDVDPEGKVLYVSSNESVATVSATGLVTPDPVNNGTAIITGSTIDGGLMDTCTVKVVDVKVESVELEYESVHIDVGEYITINAAVLPANATIKDVIYESSDTDVATVNPDGDVDGIGLGECTITVTTVEGQLVDTCAVEVGYHVTSITVAGGQADIGETLQLNPAIEPANATNKNITYSLSDTNIATVDANGLVTAVSLGTVTITVTAEDGGITGECTFVSGHHVESVSLSPETMEILVDGTGQVTPEITPANATNKNVTYQSGNENIATVDAVGVVWGIAPGTVTITVTTEDGSFQDTTEVTVIQRVKSVSVSPEKIHMALASEPVKLSVEVLPQNASDKTVTYTSSDTLIATVDEFGTVTPVGVGEAIITAMANDGSLESDTCTVKVVEELISSDVYLVNREDLFFEDVAIETSVKDIILSINSTVGTIRILDTDMAEVTKGNVSTGYFIQKIIDGDVADELQILIEGDCNPDTILDVIDYTMIRLHILDIVSLSGLGLEVADVNDDGIIDVIDYTLVRLHILEVLSLYD